MKKATRYQPTRQKVEKRANGSVRVSVENTLPSMTQQQFKDECDLNKIVARYDKKVWDRYSPQLRGQFMDLTNITDYQTSLNNVIQAQNAFNELPARTRDRFNNDPNKLLQFLQDKNNHDEGVRLGIFDPKKQNTENQNTHTTPNTETKNETTKQ